MMPKLVAQMLNVGLRLTALAAKLGLMLYLGRYFSLSDMGIYGLVLGASMFLSWVLGMKIDYMVSREIVGLDPVSAACKMRDQAVFYTLNYLALAVVALAAGLSGMFPVDGKIIFFITALSVAEGYAGMTYTNMNSLGQPLQAKFLFFIRAGLWVFPVALLGLLFPAWRHIDVVLGLWLLGVLASLVATTWVWRHMPWRATYNTPIDWTWLRQNVKQCLFIWLGTIGIAGGTYVDRFIVAHYLTLDYAGIATFYASFAAALLTLSQSGVLAFSYPRMIKLHRDGDEAGFRIEARQTLWHVALFAAAVSIVVGIGVPVLAQFLDRPKLAAESFTLWLMLFAVWLRSNAETLYYILYARHQDKPLWLGSLLFLIPALGSNLLLVPPLGLSGMGYSMILAAAFMFFWRLWYVVRGNVQQSL